MSLFCVGHTDWRLLMPIWWESIDEPHLAGLVGSKRKGQDARTSLHYQVCVVRMCDVPILGQWHERLHDGRMQIHGLWGLDLEKSWSTAGRGLDSIYTPS